jgi:hypothetical protein
MSGLTPVLLSELVSLGLRRYLCSIARGPYVKIAGFVALPSESYYIGIVLSCRISPRLELGL